jgi:hypothetical protein
MKKQHGTIETPAGPIEVDYYELSPETVMKYKEMINKPKKFWDRELMEMYKFMRNGVPDSGLYSNGDWYARTEFYKLPTDRKIIFRFYPEKIKFE